MSFSEVKAKKLKGLDHSRKGSIDDYIKVIVEFINKHHNYFTTSSCSGRIIIFTQPEDSVQHQKKGCCWLLVSHTQVDLKSCQEVLKSHEGSAIFKFEPFIVHVNCETLENARLMHTLALEAGYKNSGLTISKKGNITLAIRSTSSLEAPLSKDGKLLVSDEYLEYLVEKGNQKMAENFQRIDRLFEILKNRIGSSPSISPSTTFRSEVSIEVDDTSQSIEE